MWTKETRSLWRRAKVARAREDSIISGYVREKYKKIYGEAAGFYNQLNAKYPNKPNLRKVKEFKALSKEPDLKEKNPKRKYPNIDVNRTCSFRDNLQLRIPLLQTKATPPTDPVQNVEITTTPELVLNVIQEATPPPDPVQNVIHKAMPPDPVQNVEITTTPELVSIQEAAAPTSDLQFGQIDNAVIDRIVSELQKDPGLQNIFDDIEFNEATPAEADDIFW